MVLVAEVVPVLGRAPVVEEEQAWAPVALVACPVAGRAQPRNQGRVHLRNTHHLIDKTNMKDNMEDWLDILQGNLLVEVLAAVLAAEAVAVQPVLHQVNTTEHHNPNVGHPQNSHDL